MLKIFNSLLKIIADQDKSGGFIKADFQSIIMLTKTLLTKEISSEPTEYIFSTNTSIRSET